MQLGQSAAAILRRAGQVIATHSTPALTDAQHEARSWSLAQFLRWCWPIVEPNTPLEWNWHLDAVCEHVQAALQGTLGKRNLLVLVPPGSGKSSVISVASPAWMWVRNPAWRAIFASGAASVSTRDSLKCRSILDSAQYRGTFGIPWTFAEDQNAKLLYRNSRTGFRMATTAGSRITGERADAIFCDDALDAAAAYSKAARDAVNVWWDQGFANRLNDLRAGVRVVVQQRLHHEDLGGHIIATEPERWEVLTIPQQFEQGRRTTTSLGWTDPRKEDGELMFPQRFTAEVVAAERARLGRSGFDGQHQQRPSAAMGEIFKRGFLRIRPRAAGRPATTRCIQSWDTGFKVQTANDPSCGLQVLEFEQGYLLDDIVHQRLSYPQLKEKAATWASANPVTALLVEDKASGQSLVQELQTTTKLPVVACPVYGDKVVRAHVCVPTWEAGRIWVWDDAPWVDSFLDELYSFPRGMHDDRVDAFTQALIYLMGQPEGSGIMQFYERLAQQAEQQTATLPAPDAPVASDSPPWHRSEARATDLLGGLQLGGVAGFLR